MLIAMAATSYSVIIFLPNWMEQHLGMDRTTTLEINAANIIIAGVALAALSDRIGRKPVLVTIMAIQAVLLYPMFWLISQGDPKVVAAAQCALFVLAAGFSCLLPATLSTMFPWQIRTSGVNFILNLAALAVHLCVLALISTIACLLLKERCDVEWQAPVRVSAATPLDILQCNTDIGSNCRPVAA